MESSCGTCKSLVSFLPSVSPAFVPQTLSYRCLRTQKPLLPLRFSPKPSSIRSSYKPIRPEPLIPDFGPLRNALAAAAVPAAALLFSRFVVPPRAIAAVVSESPAVVSTGSVHSDQALTDEERERELESRLESCPDDVASLRSLMELKIKAGKFPDAIAAVDRLIQLQPGEKDLRLLKAHIQSYGGDAESARLGFEVILAEDPLSVEAFHGLVMAQREAGGELDGVLRRIESAVEACEKLNRVEDARDFKLLVAQVKVISDQYEEALKIYEEMTREAPQDFRPYLCQGIIYTLLKKKDEAEKQFDKYRRLLPKEHPYAQYFDDNVIAMKLFSQMEANKRKNEALRV